MSRKTLPLLYLNLGGEMMYIIEERLTAQSVPADKSAKVLTDLVSLLFNPKILEEILQPQEIHTREALEVIFENIANSTAMRIDANSLHRMFSIMIMSVKYQVQRCGSPLDLMGVTLNHMDGMRGMLVGTSRAHLLLEKAYDTVITAYTGINIAEFCVIRHTLLSFFHDSRSRVRKYIENGQQLARSGKFTIPKDANLSYNVKKPVQIKYFDQNGKCTKLTMVHDDGVTYTEHNGVISWAMTPKTGETRGTHLGTNFHKFGDLDPASQEDAKSSDHFSDSKSDSFERSERNRPMSRQELALLRTVIDSRGGQPNSTFQLNLYKNDDKKKPTRNYNKAKEPPKGKPGGRVVLPKIEKPARNGAANGAVPGQNGKAK